MPAVADENQWSRLLNEVYAKSSNSLPAANVLVLGDNESGKTSLVAVMQRADAPIKGNGLEYHYLDVVADYGQQGSYAYMLGSTAVLPDVGPGEATRLGVYVLDGDVSFAPLIKFAVNASALDRSMVMLCASVGEPWTISDALTRWARLLDDHMSNMEVTNKQAVTEAKDRQERFWQEYVEPLDSSSHSEMGAKVPSMEMSEHMILPLGDGVLEKNLGVPIIVCITKCDQMTQVEKDCSLSEQHWDFIQQHVRRFCLKYGAACVYTSAKDKRNIDQVYKYMLHRIFGFPFTMPANVVDKDAIFIPAGWDNLKKIKIVQESLITIQPDDNYSEHIRKPHIVLHQPKKAAAAAAAATGPELTCDDNQKFLQRMHKLMLSGEQHSTNASTATGERTQQGVESPLPARSSVARGALPAGGKQNSQAMRSTSPNKAAIPPGSKTTGAPAPPTTGNPDTLQQFFSNLLKQQKSGSSLPASNANSDVSSSEGKPQHAQQPAVVANGTNRNAE